jgi:hypothetical protein
MVEVDDIGMMEGEVQFDFREELGYDGFFINGFLRKDGACALIRDEVYKGEGAHSN